MDVGDLQDFQSTDKNVLAKRLNLMLSKADIYSKWLASKLEARQLALSNPKCAEIDGDVIGNDDDVSQQKSTKENETITEPPTKRRRSARNSLASTNSTTVSKPKQTKNTSKNGIAKNSTESALAMVDHTKARATRQPQTIVNCTMREYQLVGLDWLISLFENGLNGILADEMGLGKTLQTIAFLAHLREMGVWGPFLIVAPLSTLENWVNEIIKFYPSAPVLLYHGTPDARQRFRDKEMSKPGFNFPIIVTSYEICMNDRKHLQNYTWKYIIVDEGHRIKNLNCKLVQELKSYHSANRLLLTGTPLQNNLTELWSLLNFLMPEIFDNLNTFQEWFDFNDLHENDGDAKLMDREHKTSVVANLHNILKPFLLRRIKAEVEIGIPNKKEYLIFCPLMPRQRELYRAAILNGSDGIRTVLTNEAEEDLKEYFGESAKPVEVEKVVVDIPMKRKTRLSTAGVNSKLLKTDDDSLSDNEYFDKLENGDFEKTIAGKELDHKKEALKMVGSLNLGNILMQIRKICNHPWLFDFGAINAEGSQQEDGKLTPEDTKDEEEVSATIVPPKRGLSSTNLITELPEISKISGKMLMLERLLPALFADHHRVLIFSQFTSMLDLIGDWLDYRGEAFSRIDGMVKIEDRRVQIKQFTEDPLCRVFLLSTRAGGLGINLTSADTVIIFDSDWNPQMDLQAQDRVHRIGQTKPVIIYRFVTRDTVESRILDKASQKRKLERLVIHKGHFKGSGKYYSSNKTINAKDLASTLIAEELEKVGASDGSEEHDDKEYDKMKLLSDVLSDIDLERITDRSDEVMNAKKVDEEEGVDVSVDNTGFKEIGVESLVNIFGDS